MSGCSAKTSMSELLLSAAFFLQQQNGVSVMEIAEYVGEKRCCDPCKLRGPIKIALNKAKEHGILCESKGLYRIESKYEDKLDKDELNPKKADDNDENGDDECTNNQCQNDALNQDQKSDQNKGQNGGDCNPDQECKDEDDDDEDDDDDDGCNDREDIGEPMAKKRRTLGKSKGLNYGKEDDW